MLYIRKVMAGAAAVLAVGLAAPALAQAAGPYYVGTTADGAGATDCANSANTDCTLRAAIQAANAGAGTITINVPAGIYKLTCSSTDCGSAYELQVNSGPTVDIEGAGSGSTIIDANYNDRAFLLASGSVVTIAGTTIEHGRPGGIGNLTSCPASPTAATNGGAILDSGTLTLTDDVLSDNLTEGDGGGIEDNGTGLLTITGTTLGGSTSAAGNYACASSNAVAPIFAPPLGNGGAIDESAGGAVTIDSSTLSENHAANDGGAVDEASGENASGSGALGSMTITDSTIQDNTAGNQGGGVASELDGNFGTGGQTTLFADLLTSNTAGGDGGGVGASANTKIVNTTITNDTADAGGGIYATWYATTVSFSTIYANTATGKNAFTTNGGNIDGCGDCGGNVALDDSIVAGGIGSPGDCGLGVTTDNGYNLYDNASAESECDQGSPGPGDRTGTPKLGALANNGGPTQTEALESGSPAINNANPDNTTCEGETSADTYGMTGPLASAGPIDQRGDTRPFGSACDIGAFELQSKPAGGGGVSKTTPTVSTTVFDASTNSAWTDKETTGASAYDTTKLGGTVSGQVPSGSVTYEMFDNGSCSGSAASTDTETLKATGEVPNSKPSTPLAAGPYSYQASYTGDANYNAATGTCEPFAVGQQPDVGVTAVPETNPIVVGEEDVVTDTIHNNGASTATQVHFTDPGAGFTLDAVKPSQGTCTHTATTVSCQLGRLPAGATTKIRIRLTAKSPGTITLTSSVSMAQTDPTPSDNRARVAIEVKPASTPLADLAVTVTPSAHRVSVGGSFTYALVAANNGPDSGHQVSITDHLPGNVTLVSIRPPAGISCTGTMTIRCTLSDFAAFRAEKIRIRVRAAEAGEALDIAHITDASPADPNLKNNHDRAMVTVVASSRPTVGVIHVGAACHSESSTIRLRAVAYASTGIKQVSLALRGHGYGQGIASAPPTGGPSHYRLRFGMSVKASSLLAGRTYLVVATVTDTLGRRSRATAHLRICGQPKRQGFTG